MASILELSLESVPDFHMNDDNWLQEVNSWLNPVGWQAVLLIPVKGHPLEDCIGKSYAIAGGVSPRDDGGLERLMHAVVLRGSKVVHDPMPSGEGLKGRVLDITVLVPMNPAKYFKRNA